METKRLSSPPDFEAKPTTRKGKVGEGLVDAHLFGSGIVPYGPLLGRAHPFDRLCASQDKKDLFVVEVKSKARRNFYPDTGVDIRHYNDYMHIKEHYAIPVFIYFVDEMLKRVYGGEIGWLARPRTVIHNRKPLEYPLRQNGIIYFPLVNMTVLCPIEANAAEQLRALSTRKYDYKMPRSA